MENTTQNTKTSDYQTCTIHGEVEVGSKIINGELVDTCPLCESEMTNTTQNTPEYQTCTIHGEVEVVPSNNGIVYVELCPICESEKGV